MKKIVIVPDSFKGTLTSQEICERIAAEVRRFFPCCQVITLPVADGGEGSVDCFLAALGGQKRLATVKGPFFEDRKAAWGLLPDGSAAGTGNGLLCRPALSGRETGSRQNHDLRSRSAAPGGGGSGGQKNHPGVRAAVRSARLSAARRQPAAYVFWTAPAKALSPPERP